MDLVGDSIAFLVLSGQSMRAFYQIVCDGSCPPYGQSAWIVTIGSVGLILCLVSLKTPALYSMQDQILQHHASNYTWC